MKEEYVIEIERPPDCSVALMKEYLRAAIRNWVGGMEPDHPLYNSFDAEGSVKVRRVTCTSKTTSTKSLESDP